MQSTSLPVLSSVSLTPNLRRHLVRRRPPLAGLTQEEIDAEMPISDEYILHISDAPGADLNDDRRARIYILVSREQYLEAYGHE